ncbi:MAG: sulfatase [Flavobacteriales bacterium]|nr:sulfatase [Flavobacteriales bacterium]
MKKTLLISLVLPIMLNSCSKDSLKEYKTENVIIMVVDGQRYSESWGDSTHQYIPHFSTEIADFGIVNTAFYNNGLTSTVPGFTAITTGVYQEINNSGQESPIYPSIFQYLIEKDSTAPAWIINSKDKLAVLGNCQQTNWSNKYMPLLDCGIDGLGSGYRHDTLTLARFFNVMSEYHPKLTLLGFREPDFSAHTNSWDDYIEGIINTDEYIYRVWNYIQNDPHYSGRTTLFITNDHGRHLDNIGDGFKSHGDGCDGCRHINFFAYGPDFKKGVINHSRELIDIPATITEILQLNAEYVEGKIMYELFE